MWKHFYDISSTPIFSVQFFFSSGAENILRAFSEANSSKAKGSVSEAKQQVKDCTQNMCHLEAELEVNLGVFIMKIEGDDYSAIDVYYIHPVGFFFV